jgi:hypothetical protein
MAVPVDLRGVFNRKMWRHYLGRLVETEARVAALTLALRYKQEIERLRGLSSPEPANGVVPSGPIAHLNNVHAALPNGSGAPRIDLEHSKNGTRHPSSPDQPANGAIVMPPDFGDTATSAEDKASPDVMTLVPVWQRVAQPRAQKSVQRMQHSARLFIEAVGQVSPQEVTRQDVMRFRDRVEGMGLSHRSATQYLELVHRLFGVALSEGLVEHNPAAGIKIRKMAGRFADSQRRRPFEPDHIRALLATTADEPEEFRWIIRILAYHGMRSGEVTQLRVEDVTSLFGVPVMRVHDRFGSIKNRFSQRDVPLHPCCLDLLAYAKRVDGPWLFDRMRWRADRFQ